MNRITNGYAKKSVAKFSADLKVIVSCLSGNQLFSTLKTEVSDLSTEADNFYALELKAASRDKNVILARNTCRNRVITMLHDLGMAVTAIAKGDLEVLAASGMPYTQPKKRTAPMVKPAVPKVNLGTNNGEIACRTTSQPGMKSVNFYIASDIAAAEKGATNAWQITSWNETKFTFSNLVPGQRYAIKVGLVGVRGQEVISDAVTYIAQ